MIGTSEEKKKKQIAYSHWIRNNKFNAIKNSTLKEQMVQQKVLLNLKQEWKTTSKQVQRHVNQTKLRV